MGRTCDFRRLAFDPEVEGDFLVALVQDDRGDFTLGVNEGRGEERAAAGRGGDAFRAGAYEFGEVADVVEGVGVDEAARTRVCVERGEAEVADVIRAAGLVQKDVPVSPGRRAVVEVVNHRVAVVLAELPIVHSLHVESVVAAFGEDERLVWEGLVHEPDVVVHRFAAAPGFVPVIGDAPDVARGFGVCEDRAGALIDEVAVMIPGEDFPVGQTFSAQGRAEVVLQEITLLFGGVDTGFPLLRRHRLVLNGDSPDVYAFPLIRLDELRVVVGPRLIKLCLELAAVQHVSVLFHEGGRTPGACEDREPPARRGQRALDERDAELSVVFDAEAL